MSAAPPSPRNQRNVRTSYMLDSMAWRHRKPRSGTAPRTGSRKLAPDEVRDEGEDAIRGNRPSNDSDPRGAKDALCEVSASCEPTFDDQLASSISDLVIWHKQRSCAFGHCFVHQSVIEIKQLRYFESQLTESSLKPPVHAICDPARLKSVHA